MKIHHYGRVYMNNTKELKRIFNEYGLKFTKERETQLLERAKSYEVEYVLDYLINELKISPRNIEKCPSILYRKVTAVKKNYEFLRRKYNSRRKYNFCFWK